MITPMWFQIAGVIFNFVFDPLLIFGIGPFPKMGIRGAALATVLGYALSMVIAFLLLVFTKQKVRIKIKGFHVDSHMFKESVFLWISFICYECSWIFYADIYQSVFNSLFRYCCCLFWRLFQSTTDDLHDSKWLDPRMFACHEIQLQCQTARTFKRSFSFWHTGGNCYDDRWNMPASVFTKQILFLFAASESMIKIGVPAMRILSIGLVFCGFSIMIATYQQAIEKIQSSMLIHILRQGILLVPLMWLFNHMFGINGIWISFPVTEILVFIVAVLLQTVIPKPQ